MSLNNKKGSQKMRKKIGLICSVLVLSLMGATQAFALSDTKKSDITVTHVDYDGLSKSEKASINKGTPEIDVSQDTYNIKMIYQKISGGKELPNTGVNAVSPLVFIGVVLLAVGLMLYFKKTGRVNLFGIVIVGTIIAVGAIGAMNIYADSTVLIQDTTVTIQKGEIFSQTPEKIDGYRYLGYIYTSENNPDEVIEDKESLVEVNYRDELGNSLAKTTQIKGIVNKPYKIEVLNIEGYQFIEFKGNHEGVFTTDKQTVTAVYRKNDFKIGSVTIRYQDSLGNAIKPDLNLTGTVGSVFKVDIPKITNYTFDHIENLGNALFTKEHQIITLVYNKVIAEGNLVVKYRDVEGNTIKPQKVITGTVGSAYAVSVDDINEYQFVKFVGNNIGTFTEEQQEVTIVYEKETKYMTTVIRFKRVQNGLPTENNVALPDLSKFQTKPLDFSNYYLKFKEPITSGVIKVPYGEVLETVTIENREFKLDLLPTEIELNTYYTDVNNVEQESFASIEPKRNGYTGDGSVTNGGYSDYKAVLGDVPEITYDEVTKTVTVTYTCMYIPVIIDF